MKKNNFFKGLLMLMLAFFATTSALAQELKLSAEKCFLAPGETTSVVVNLTNEEKAFFLTGYVQLPEGLSFVSEGDVINHAKVGRTEKNKSFSLRFEKTTYDEQRGYFNFTFLSGLEAGNGEIFTFEVKASDKLALSQVITFDKVNITPVDNSKPIFEQGSFNVLACNSEYKLDFTVDPIKVTVGKPTKVAVNLGFEKDKLAGLQFDLVLPAGLKAVNTPEVVEERCPDHFANLAANGHFVVIPTYKPVDFVGTSGQLCSFEIQADENFVDGSEIQFNNILAATGGAIDVPSVAYYAPNLKVKVVKDGTATGINGIESDFAAKADGIYTISGLKVNKLVKGVNIVVKDGKATKIVKK